MKCPKCSAKHIVKYGKARGKQRFRCHGCGYQFTSEQMHAHALEERLFAMTLLASGLSMHAVGKVLGVSAQTILRWKRSGLVNSDKISKALRVRMVLRSGKVKTIKDNEPSLEEEDDFVSGDLYVLETRLPSGVRVDIAVKRKRKPLQSDK
ncbi:MAG: IS1 family transposase [Alphaproteobacteria bacterium]|nr:IS1 family transposase [Alphaproteobacteria bacterium]